MLYRFEVQLSDIDRGVYQTLSFRLAQHPSETGAYLLSRAMAYLLSYQDGLEIVGAGLGDPDGPALRALDQNGHGGIQLWIEIGNPSARKLHKASKVSKKLVIYTYKNLQNLLQELRSTEVHRSSEIQIFALDSKFLDALEAGLQKSNRWSVLVQDGQVDVTVGDQAEAISTKIVGQQI